MSTWIKVAVPLPPRRHGLQAQHHENGLLQFPHTTRAETHFKEETKIHAAKTHGTALQYSSIHGEACPFRTHKPIQK
jgi:hypothetical protein